MRNFVEVQPEFSVQSTTEKKFSQKTVTQIIYNSVSVESSFRQGVRVNVKEIY